MSFENITNKIWEELRGGPSPDNGPYEESFYGARADEGINFDTLIKFIIRNKSVREIYDRSQFEHHYSALEDSLPFDFNSLTSVIYQPQNIPFQYKNNQGKAVTIYLNGLLNKRTDYLDSKWAIQIKIDPIDKLITASLHFFYANTEKFRSYDEDTIDDDDFFIPYKYLAIALTSKNLTEFCSLMGYLFGNYYKQWCEKEIAHELAHSLKKTKDPVGLNFLYQNIPDFAFALIPNYINFSLFQKHLDILLDYDDTGYFSWFKDSSGSIISLLHLIASGNSQKLFNYLKKSPKLIKRIYHNFDGSSFIDGYSESNYVIFANLLYAICLVNGFDGLERKKTTFYIGKNYKLDSNLFSGNDNESDKIFLKQYKNYTTTRTEYEMDDYGVGTGSQEYTTVETLAVDPGHYFSPLDLIYLIDDDSKDKTRILVPAILVKAVSDKKEWNNILRNIRIGLDLLAIIIGVASLGTASPLVYSLAVIDLGLSATDAIVALSEDYLMQSPEGRAFLENWDSIMLAGGVVTASPSLLKSTFRLGAKLLSRATLLETKTFLSASLLKIIQTTNKISIGAVRIILDFSAEFGVQSLARNLEQLYNEGFILLKGSQSNANRYYLVYKSEILLTTNFSALKREISSIFKFKGKNLILKINSYILALRKTKSVINTGAEIGEELDDITKKWGTVKMKLLEEEYAAFLSIIEQKGIKLIETYNLDDVYYQVTKIIDKKRQVIRVEKTLSVHPEMRFLDLQHEIDHIIQFEETLGDQFCTSIRFDGYWNEASRTKVTNLGRLDENQMDFLEYENRLREINRLKQNNVDEKIINKHIEGIIPYKKRFIQYEVRMKNWMKKYFPHFNADY